MFAEIRNDFYDEEENCWYIDGWFTDDESESGVVVARVFSDGRVIYRKSSYATDAYVLDAVKECQKDIEESEGVKHWTMSVE